MHTNQTLASLRFTLMYSLAILVLSTSCGNFNRPDTASPTDGTTSSLSPRSQQASEPAPTEAEEKNPANLMRDAAQVVVDMKFKYANLRNRKCTSANALQAAIDGIKAIETHLEQAKEVQNETSAYYVANIQTFLALAKVVQAAIQAKSALIEAQNAVKECTLPDAQTILKTAKSAIEQAYEAAQTAAQEEETITVPSGGFVRLAMEVIANSLGQQRDTTASVQRYLERINKDLERINKDQKTMKTIETLILFRELPGYCS